MLCYFAIWKGAASVSLGSLLDGSTVTSAWGMWSRLVASRREAVAVVRRSGDVW